MARAGLILLALGTPPSIEGWALDLDALEHQVRNVIGEEAEANSA